VFNVISTQTSHFVTGCPAVETTIKNDKENTHSRTSTNYQVVDAHTPFDFNDIIYSHTCLAHRLISMPPLDGNT